jgi:hypothetical protein
VCLIAITQSSPTQACLTVQDVCMSHALHAAPDNNALAIPDDGLDYQDRLEVVLQASSSAEPLAVTSLQLSPVPVASSSKGHAEDFDSTLSAQATETAPSTANLSVANNTTTTISPLFTLQTGMNFTAPKIYENSLCEWEECKGLWSPHISFANFQI